MSTKYQASIVAEAIALDQEKQRIEERIKEIKADLIALADEEPADRRTPTDGGGHSVTYETADGSIARVTHPAPKLKSSVDAETKDGAKLKELVGREWDRLFRPVVRYSLVDQFRTLIEGAFTPREAKAVLKLVTTKSSPTVSFEVKEVA